MTTEIPITLSDDVRKKITNYLQELVVHHSIWLAEGYSQIDLPIAGLFKIRAEACQHKQKGLGGSYPVFHMASPMALFLHANFGICGI